MSLLFAAVTGLKGMFGIRAGGSLPVAGTPLEQLERMEKEFRSAKNPDFYTAYYPMREILNKALKEEHPQAPALAEKMIDFLADKLSDGDVFFQMRYIIDRLKEDQREPLKNKVLAILAKAAEQGLISGDVANRQKDRILGTPDTNRRHAIPLPPVIEKT